MIKEEKMDEYLKVLQEKYGYNNELIVALRKIVPAFIEHLLKNDTRLLLSLIYRNYWCNEEKKKELFE